MCLFIYVCMYLCFLHIKGWCKNGANLICRYLKCVLYLGEKPYFLAPKDSTQSSAYVYADVRNSLSLSLSLTHTRTHSHSVGCPNCDAKGYYNAYSLSHTHESFMCVPWLIQVGDVWQRVATASKCSAYTWRDFLIRVTWLTHMCTTTHPCVA